MYARNVERIFCVCARVCMLSAERARMVMGAFFSAGAVSGPLSSSCVQLFLSLCIKIRPFLLDFILC